MIEGVVIAALAAWRLSALLSYEDGPQFVFARMRARIGLEDGEPITGFWPLLFSCVWCLSVWLAPVMWLLWSVVPVVPAIIAVAALVPLIERHAH